MARATYFAPGVYVEEVPSAQQPIAGVGTNTVGFIGVVPDEIEYPEPNPDYDPVLAELALKVAKCKNEGAETPEGSDESFAEKIRRLQSEIEISEQEKSEKEAELKNAEAASAKAEQDVQELEQIPDDKLSKKQKEDLDKKEAKQSGLTKDITDLADEIQKKKNNIDGFRQQIQEMEAARGGEPTRSKTGEASALRPYRLKTFAVKAKPFDTKLCTNFREYRDRFGDFSADDPDKKPGEAKHPEHRALTHAVYGFFQNGGTRCFVARVKERTDIRQTLENFESIDAVAIVAAPGLGGDTWKDLVTHCETCEDRFAILDCPAEVGGNGSLDFKLLNYDSPGNVLPKTDRNAAFYFPYIQVVDPAKQMQDQDPARDVPLKHRGRLHVPPSGHIAGIYARTDEERGVHKAPANAPVLGAVDVKYYIGKPKHELLNPQGVNVIRNINGNVLVWGARTVGGDKNGEWKYVNVRRLFLFLRESIDEGTQWVVFEPNDRALWGKIRRNVSDFLRNVWRSGALFGSTPEEAFYVKCDDETNPREVRELGQVVTEIGVAIVRPAEFVIFRITQWGGPQSS